MSGVAYPHSGVSPPSYCPCQAHNVTSVWVRAATGKDKTSDSYKKISTNNNKIES